MAHPGLLLALDQGTTSSRAIAFEVRSAQPGLPAGESPAPVEIVVRGFAQQEFPQHTPSPAEVEHDPEEIWESQLASARRVIADVGGPEHIAAIGVANQRETTVLWDRNTGKPLAPAIVWQSRVSEGICEELRRAGHEPILRERTGLLLDPYFSGSKILHLLRRIPGLEAAAARGDVLFGTVDSFLLWRLTGGRTHATDITNASRTLLFDIHQGRWSDSLCRLFGVTPRMLPDVRPSCADFGPCEPSWFGRPIPIRALAGDQQAAAFAQGCFSRGDAKTTYGTGAFLMFCTGDEAVPSHHGLVTTPGCACGPERTFFLEGSVFVAGAAVQWLRDGLGIIPRAADVEALAASVPDSGGVTFVPALTGLGAPLWDAAARGAILGISRGTTAAHVARATLEGVAASVADVVDCMGRDSGQQVSRFRVDGGAAANDLLLQIQADWLGVPVERPAILESTALGAALLAGRGCGLLDRFAPPPAAAVFHPRLDAEARRRKAAVWRDSIDRITARGSADCGRG
jgi:glycerol kinase